MLVLTHAHAHAHAGKPQKIALHVDVAATVKCYRYYAGWADGKITGKTIPIEGESVHLNTQALLHKSSLCSAFSAFKVWEV